jgi:hypothetical protein
MSEQWTVSVLRPAPVHSERERADADRALADSRFLGAWLAPDEYALLTPGGRKPDGAAALAQARDVVAAFRRPCQLGSAAGVAGRLADTLSSAREVSRVAPLEDRPTRLYAIADLFVEMSVASVPQVDAWLHDFAERLAAGPRLVETLHTYYRQDMSRLSAASALNVHPRTLDYRLRRVREATGIDPGSTVGIRILSAAVARIRAGERP